MTQVIPIHLQMDLRSYGVDGQVIHTPGHTPGSISVVTEDGKAIVGDIMGGGLLIGVLFRQRPRYHYFATDVSMVRSSIKRLMGLSLSKVYVGHGGPLEMSAVRKWFFRESDPSHRSSNGAYAGETRVHYEGTRKGSYNQGAVTT